jgi:antitoxin component YwqK of YwqJK toxin-antitoxin module
MQLTDKKKKKYTYKEYFESGKTQTEGTMQYYDELDNFLQEGKWNVYDENGKLIAVQEYVRGQMVEEKKM